MNIKKLAPALPALLLPTVAFAQSGPFASLSTSLCTTLRFFAGPSSTFLSLLFLVVLAIFLFMWWMNESKEGPMLWFIRTGVVVALLVNIFTLPPMFGMAAVTC
jgi:type IV secretory pathway VirB2 component (pilin)